MKNKRKIISLAILLIITSMTIIACGDKPKTEDGTTTKQESKDTSNNNNTNNNNVDSTFVNEKDDEGNVKDNGVELSESTKSNLEVRQFFADSIKMSFNINDTTNAEQMKMVREYQKEHFTQDLIAVSENIYKDSKSISLVDYQIKSIGKTEVIRKDGTKLNGFYVDYTAKIKVNGQDDVVENTKGETNATALISETNGKLSLEQFTTNKK